MIPQPQSIAQLTPATVAQWQADLPGYQAPVRVELPPLSVRRWQTNVSQLCTAHGVLSCAESAGLAFDLDPYALLARAREIIPPARMAERGAYLLGSFLAYQQITGTNRPIVSFRMADMEGGESVMDPSQKGQIAWNSIKTWLAARRTRVAVSMMWFEQDQQASDDILLGGPGLAPRHILVVRGYGPETYHRHTIPFIKIKFGRRTEECAIIENTLASDRRQRVPVRRLNSTTHISEAYAFAPL